MKRLKYILCPTEKQLRAKSRIVELERQMQRCNDDEKLFDLYCECCNIWDYNFEMEEVMSPGKYIPMHETIFLRRQAELATA